MNKVPPFEQPPFPSHRSISVREQRGQQPQQLRRSASAYSGSEQEAAPVEIGSKGSIFSLVGRDTSVSRQAGNGKTVSNDDASYFHVWHNRLWLVLPIASKKLNAAKQGPKKTGSLEAVVQSKVEDGVPKWKRVLQKLKGGSNKSKAKSKWKKKEETPGNQTEESTLMKCASVRIHRTAKKANFADTRIAEGKSTTPLKEGPCQSTTVSRSTTIWERRNGSQINPLGLSHLQTPRLKKAYARLQP